MKKTIIFILFAICSMLLMSQSIKYLKTNEDVKYYDVNYISINDSAFFQVLDTLLVLERKGKYYSNSVAYGVRVFKQTGEQINIIKIEGSDNKRLFVDSKDLIGFLNYSGHDFFLLSKCEELFSTTNKISKFKFDKKSDIMEDDRWPIYYFGYDKSNYYFIERKNYVPR